MIIDRRKFVTGIAAAATATVYRPGLVAAKQGEVVLGFLSASSGAFVSQAISNRIAAQIAVDEVNAAGGINGRRLKLEEFDTAGRAEQAALGLRNLVRDRKALAIVGPFSTTECQVVFPQGERLKVASMSMASSAPGLSAPYSFGFRNNVDEGYIFSRVISTIKKRELPGKSASIAHATDDAVSMALGTKVIPAVFKNAAIPVDAVVTFKVSAFDLAAQVTQLMANPSDLVGVGSPPEVAIKLVKEMRRQGHKGRLISGATIFDVKLPERMGAEGKGTIAPTTFWSELNDRTKAFTAEFQKRAQAAGMERVQPTQFDASTHSIVHIYARALADIKATGEEDRLEAERIAIRDSLSQMKPFDSIEGMITFNKDGDAVKPVYVMEIGDNGWTLLESL